jgi:hypothetical protein
MRSASSSSKTIVDNTPAENGIAKSPTNSQCPASMNSPMAVRAIERICGSKRSSVFRDISGLSILRSSGWAGGSVSSGGSGTAAALIATPAEEKISGCSSTKRTSA